MRIACLILSVIITLIMCYYSSMAGLELVAIADRLSQIRPEVVMGIIASKKIDMTLEPAVGVIQLLSVVATLFCCSSIIVVNTWWQRRLWKKK